MEAVAVGLDEADRDEVADATVVVVDVRPLLTGVLLLWIAITVYQQWSRMREVVTRHLLMIRPFRILVEAMPEINSGHLGEKTSEFEIISAVRMEFLFGVIFD